MLEGQKTRIHLMKLGKLSMNMMPKLHLMFGLKRTDIAAPQQYNGKCPASFTPFWHMLRPPIFFPCLSGTS